MKYRSARAKGFRAVKEVKQLIHAFFPELADDDVKPACHGARGEDLIFSARARKLLPISVEVKCQEKLNLRQAIAQAEKNANGWWPVVIFRRNRVPFRVVVEAKILLTLYRAAADWRKLSSENLGGQNDV